MNLAIWLIGGGFVGWFASLVMRTEGEQGVVLNVLVGIVGAAIGGWLVSPMLGMASPHPSMLSMGSLAVALLGAVVLLAVVVLIRRGTTR